MLNNLILLINNLNLSSFKNFFNFYLINHYDEKHIGKVSKCVLIHESIQLAHHGFESD